MILKWNEKIIILIQTIDLFFIPLIHVLRKYKKYVLLFSSNVRAQKLKIYNFIFFDVFKHDIYENNNTLYTIDNKYYLEII